MAALLVDLRALDRTSLPIAGGKAANLGELLRAGFPVPDGFCLTTTAYWRMVDAAGIAPRLSELLAQLDVENTQRLAAAGEKARDLVHRAAIPQEVREAIVVALSPWDGQPLAVRSSATAEDLPEASFAGQQETYLNVVGEQALLEAVRRCWASLWTDRAIAYRRRNRILHESVALAVVIQRMVGADAAGVLFTANPLSGRRTEVAIDASVGLGEAVVSGRVSPDHYIIDKRGLEITSRRIAAKTIKTVSASDGGTTTIAVDPVAGASQALSDDSLRALARLGIQIEEHFGWPQDVEWAEQQGKLYILQSRPITSLFPAPPEATDGALRVYVSGNSVQGMLEPFTPMGASLFTYGIRTVFYGGRPGPIHLIELGGRLYVDVTPVLRNPLGRRMLFLALHEVEPVIGAILARLVEDPRLALSGEPPRKTALRFLRRARRYALLLARRVAETIALPEQARRRVDDAIVPRATALRAQLAQPMALGEEPPTLGRMLRGGLVDLFFRLVPLVSAGVLCYKQAELRVRAWGLDERTLALARRALPYNKTTTMDLDLWALAQRLRADPPSVEALASPPSELAARYRAGSLPRSLAKGLADFLLRYGHRAIREIDIAMPRWQEDPSYLFGVLGSYLRKDDPEAAPDKHFARQAAAAESAVAELITAARTLPGGWHKAPVLAFFLRRYRELGGLRETPKFVLMRVFRAIRHMMLRAGEALSATGRLDRAEDVFFLRMEELKGVGDAELDLRALVAQRRREYERELTRQRAPRVLTSEGEGLHGEAVVDVAGALTGMGASPGVARGRARIVRDPLGAHLGHGEILVAPSTDPAWTPLFLTAAGLVMEAGGMMSHGSIVAREYGIPAVVGVPEATSRIAEGQMVEIDGYQGVVKVGVADQEDC